MTIFPVNADWMHQSLGQAEIQCDCFQDLKSVRSPVSKGAEGHINFGVSSHLVFLYEIQFIGSQQGVFQQKGFPEAVDYPATRGLWSFLALVHFLSSIMAATKTLHLVFSFEEPLCCRFPVPALPL